MYPTVEIIAHHTPGEPPTPLRIRFKAEDDSLVVIRIERVVDRKMERLMGNVMYVYRLSAILNHERKEIGLKYERDTMLWYLML